MRCSDALANLVFLLAAPIVLALFTNNGYLLFSVPYLTNSQKEKTTDFRFAAGSLVVLLVTAILCFACELVDPWKWPVLSQGESSIKISSRLLGLFNTAVLVALYVSLYTDWKWQDCVYNMALYTSIFSAICCSFKITWIPAGVLLVLLPFVTHDRMPFHFESAWPATVDHVYFGISFVCGVLLLRCGPLRLTSMLETSAKSKTDQYIKVYREAFPLACAGLSIWYLFICAVWKEWGHSKLWDGFYHVTWSYLRPLYILLFGAYWVKRVPNFVLVQAFGCGFGFGYFYLLCPVAQTHMSHGAEQINKLGVSAHFAESAVFYWSMVLFFAHGIGFGVWQHDSPKFRLCMVVWAIVALAIILHEKLDQLWRFVSHQNFQDPIVTNYNIHFFSHWFGFYDDAAQASGQGRSFPVMFEWELAHYTLAYWAIVVGSIHILRSGSSVRRTLMILEPDKQDSMPLLNGQ